MAHRPKDAPAQPRAKLNGRKSLRTARNSSVEYNDPRTPENKGETAERSDAFEKAVEAQERENAAKRVRTALTGSRLAIGRIEAAQAFAETLDELFAEGHDVYSLRAIAERHLKVDEKIPRRWLPDEDGIPETPMPIGALNKLPRAVAKRLLAKLFPEGLP